MIRRFVLGLVLSGIVLAVSPAAARHDEYRFVGIVTALETAKPRLSVKFKENGKDETVQILMNAKTLVTRDKKNVARSTLKVGLHVVVDALGDDYDSLEAVEIRIVPPPSTK